MPHPLFDRYHNVDAPLIDADVRCWRNQPLHVSTAGQSEMLNFANNPNESVLRREKEWF
jgi:hypothetical protein